MLSSVNASDVKNPQYVLSKFALAYPRLKAGGALLPDLIEFYQWIHTELAYLVTYNYAQNNTLEDVITKADKKYEGLDLCQLYDRVKGDWQVCFCDCLLTCWHLMFVLYLRWLQQVCWGGWWEYRCWSLCQWKQKWKDLQNWSWYKDAPLSIRRKWSQWLAIYCDWWHCKLVYIHYVC